MFTAEFWNWWLGLTVLYMLLCPPKWDIAIWWKERQERRRKERTPNPCPHGHADWDDCPVCCH